MTHHTISPPPVARPLNRRGVHPGLTLDRVELVGVRITRPAAEAFVEAGGAVTPAGQDDGHLWDVQTARMPRGLVAVNVRGRLALRLTDEPTWPVEHADYWAQASVIPCPHCGHAFSWYEAGYVPGYRVCVGPEHHHARIGP